MNQKILNWNLNLFYLFQVLFDHIHDVHGDNDHSGATLGSPHHRQVDTHERLCSGALNPPPHSPLQDATLAWTTGPQYSTQIK